MVPPTRGHGQTPGDSMPTVEAGLTVLQTEHPRSTATHQLALQTLRESDGGAYWLDARNTASTYALHETASHDRLLRQIRIARAFTAYQHFTLVERLVNRITPRTGCVIAPNFASLYWDDDVPDHEAVPLLEAAISALRQACATYDIRLLVTTAGQTDPLTEIVTDNADAEYRCEQTALGYRFEGEEFETTAYWDDTGWQTTIPYWLELFGTVEGGMAVEDPNPITAAMLGGA